MKKKLVTVLVVILVLLLLVDAGILGFVWYRDNHVFIERTPYPINAEFLNLTEKEISFDHYNALHAALPDCEILWNVPFQDGTYPSDTESISVRELTQEDIDLMKVYFPNLKKVDASACNDYVILESLKQQMPQLEIVYAVSIGSKSFPTDTTQLDLHNGDYRFEDLLANLVHLPKVETVLLHTPDLTADQITKLEEANPGVAFTCTVDILGQEYMPDVTSLDLSAMTSDQVEEVSGKLAQLPELAEVELLDADGKSNLKKEDAKALIAAAPNAVFHYAFDFYGTTLSTDTEEVKLNGQKVSEEDLRLALELMSNCKRFQLENSGLSNETLAQIRDDFRDQTKVVWRIYFGKGTSLTDAEVIRSTYDLVDDNSHDLVYCEDVRFIDIGHDEYLDGMDFIAGMPNLEVAIISGSPVKDLTPFSVCKKLRVLEAANCGNLEDITPLADCESLEMLNISYTKVKNLEPLHALNLTHLCAKSLYRMTQMPQEEQDRFTELHPDCWAMFGVDGQPYGPGWRYTKENKPMDWYAEITRVFRYPDAPNNVGWYV